MTGAVDTLVHGTSFRYWNSIRNDGLNPPGSTLSFVSHTPAKGEILKGMAKKPEILVFVNMTLAMQEGRIRFFRDDQGNIVSAGKASNHTIPPIYFHKVLNARDFSSLLSVEEVATMRVRDREKAEAEAKRQEAAEAKALKAKQAAEERAAASAKKKEMEKRSNPYLAHLENDKNEEDDDEGGDAEEDEDYWEGSRKKKMRLDEQ